MKLTKPKSLNEQIKDFKFEEVTPETVEKEKEEHEKLIDKVMKPAEKVADEVTKETAAPDVRVKKQKRLVKDRKELACLIKEAKDNNHNFTVSRSLKEGYRYVFIEDWEDEDEDWDVNPSLGAWGHVYVQDYRNFLEDAIKVCDKYSPEDIVTFRSSTYKIEEPFIGTLGGYVEMNHPVYEEDMVEGKEENHSYNREYSQEEQDKAYLEASHFFDKGGKSIDNFLKKHPDYPSDPVYAAYHDYLKAHQFDKEKKASENALRKLAKQQNEEKEPIKESAPIEELPPVEIDHTVAVNANESVINDLIQNKFAEIEQLKSAISTLPYGNVNEDIINIINSILDDANVHIGMLQKAIEIIKPESSDAIEAGKEKAAEIVDIKSEEEEKEEEE